MSMGGYGRSPLPAPPYRLYETLTGEPTRHKEAKKLLSPYNVLLWRPFLQQWKSFQATNALQCATKKKEGM